ncbi:MAG: DUF3137 domain-containing protein [Planctomycetes bacterium]|nr:DUF3137 domain-containing protein [Planctomycetota bacterium]
MLLASEVFVVIPFLVAMAGIAVWAVLWSVKVQDRAIEAWRRFASDRDLRFVMPESPWYRGKEFRIEGEVRGIAFRIEKQVVRHGKHSRTYTRLVARGSELSRAEVKVLPNNFATRLGKVFGGKSRPLGDTDFDELFVVYAKDTVDPRDVIGEAARTKLVEFAKLCDLVIEGSKVTLRWNQLERDPERLQHAIELAVLFWSKPRAAVAH